MIYEFRTYTTGPGQAPLLVGSFQVKAADVFVVNHTTGIASPVGAVQDL